MTDYAFCEDSIAASTESPSFSTSSSIWTPSIMNGISSMIAPHTVNRATHRITISPRFIASCFSFALTCNAGSNGSLEPRSDTSSMA